MFCGSIECDIIISQSTLATLAEKTSERSTPEEVS